MKTTTKRFLSMLLITVMALCLLAMPAFAATNKVVKKQKFTTSASVANKKAATVKKGSYRLTFKNGEGYLKFKAPKAGKYSFTFSNVRKNSFGASSYVSLMKVSPYSSSYITFTKGSTYGGKTDTLWLSVNGASFSNYKKIYRPIAKRTATLKLNKNEVLYFYFYASSGKTTSNLVIKKK